MFKEVLAYVNVTFVVSAVAFVLGVAFSQKIKDWFKGIPADVRQGLNNVEAAIIAKSKQITADTVAKVQAVAAPTPTVTPVPQVQPVPAKPA